MKKSVKDRIPQDEVILYENDYIIITRYLGYDYHGRINVDWDLDYDIIAYSYMYLYTLTDKYELYRYDTLEKLTLSNVLYLPRQNFYDKHDFYIVHILDDKSPKVGLIRDCDGKIIIPIDYFIERINDTLFVVKNIDYKYGIFDVNQGFIMPLKYNRIIGFTDGLFIVVDNSGCGIYDASKGFVLPLEYDDIFRHKYSKFIIEKDGTRKMFDALDGLIYSKFELP